MSSDVSKCEQVVFELLCKVAELIVSSKVALQQQQRREINSKFSLHVQELVFVRDSMKAWENNLTTPVGIDIFREEQRPGDTAPRLELLERWEIMYKPRDAPESKSAQLRHFFKRSIILLRTLYSFVRLLPAYGHLTRAIPLSLQIQSSRNTGFSLYPIRPGSGGSGLDFSSSADGGEEEHAGHGARGESTRCYAFKPLTAPHGTVNVTCNYRRGVDSKVGWGRSAPSATPAPDMTTSLIQDYVPGEYERNAAAAAGRMPASETNQDWPQLPSTPEDGTVESGPRGGVADSDASHAPPEGAGGKVEGGGADMMHWPPSPELGHGYAEKRLITEPRQGPRPFSTPGPHRGRLLGHDVMMEPLELGPNADINGRASPVPVIAVQQESDDVYDVAAEPVRASTEALSLGNRRTESRYVDSRRSAEIDRAGGGGDVAAAEDRASIRRYRRNSISESPSTAQQLHGVRSGASGYYRHGGGGAAEYTPPFSYCEEAGSAPPTDSSPLALGQPLVSFSPPFDAACTGSRGHDGAFLARVHPGSRTPVSALLETLPESPFSLQGRRGSTQPPGTSPASFSRQLLPARLENSASQAPAFAASVGVGRAEGIQLPFAADVQDDGPGVPPDSGGVLGAEGGLDSSAAPSALYALCSAASSKSIFVMHNTPSSEDAGRAGDLQPEGGESSVAPNPPAYASTAGMIVRSLEEDLEGFRQFHLELEKKR
ncbi:unnamed protein product [Scytosiphon promiscuus]